MSCYICTEACIPQVYATGWLRSFSLRSSHCCCILPTTDSPGYIAVFDPKEDPEEDPADYPADRGDDDDDDDESSDNDEDDDDDDVEEEEGEDKDEEEEEHLALVDSRLKDFLPYLLGHHHHLHQLIHATFSIPTLLVSSPLPMSPLPLPASPTHPLGYRDAMVRLIAKSLSTSHPLPIVLLYTKASVAMMRAVAPSTYIIAPQSGILPSDTPPSGTPPLLPIPLLIHITFDFFHYDVREVFPRPTRELMRDYGFVATLDDEIRRDLERDVGYGITDT
ncbi:hypothetical protein Tco_1220970 [Tanacetum coccineum]